MPMYLSRLKDLREDEDLTQKEVAAILKIDQRVYSNYETGKRELPISHLIALADFIIRAQIIFWAGRIKNSLTG